MKAVFIIAAVAMLFALATARKPVFDMEQLDQIVQKVNGDCMSTWKAEIDHEFFAHLDAVDVGNLFGARNFDKSVKKPVTLRVKQAHEFTTRLEDLPENFMTSDKFVNCNEVIKTVTDQSACGSCWGVSAAQSASERYCIKTGQPTFLASRQLLGCCSQCGDGCEGGWPDVAMDYIVSKGLPSGHPNNQNTTLCVRYPFLSCMHHTEGEPQCSDYDFSTPSCAKACDPESTYSTPIGQDLRKGKDAYSVYGEANMMKELYEQGSIAVAYSVYQDFMTYKSGIYKHTTGSFLGGHAVSLQGWGVDPQTKQKYWVVKNNWNNKWGESGYFRIARSTDECGIESEGSAVTF